MIIVLPPGREYAMAAALQLVLKSWQTWQFQSANVTLVSLNSYSYTMVIFAG
jgi:hypothetical protein